MTKIPAATREGGGPTRGDRIRLAYERLRELIVWGQLAPGSRIIESDVAERLRISRTPVRSALHRLQQEGYINASGGGRQLRLSVAPLTQHDARELFSIVGEVEGLAARKAAELPMSERRELIRTMAQFNNDLLEATLGPRPDRHRVFDLDTAFHRAYVDAAAGPRLVALHDSIKPQAERYIRLYISALADEIGQSVEEHAVIIATIQAGDAEAANHSVRTNWRNAAERLDTVIAAVGERGSW